MGTFGSPSVDRLERLDASAFSGRRLLRNGPWAVAFLATWCPFCRQFAPAFATLGTDHVRLAIGDVTSDESPLWDLFGIDVIPTVLVFRDGTVVRRFDGRPSVGLGPGDLEEIRAALSPA